MVEHSQGDSVDHDLQHSEADILQMFTQLFLFRSFITKQDSQIPSFSSILSRRF